MVMTNPRRFGPPAHDQRGKHTIKGELRAPQGLGVVEEFPFDARDLPRVVARGAEGFELVDQRDEAVSPAEATKDLDRFEPDVEADSTDVSRLTGRQ